LWGLLSFTYGQSLIHNSNVTVDVNGNSISSPRKCALPITLALKVDTVKKFALSIAYLPTEIKSAEFSWLLEPQYFINNKNAISFSMSVFFNKEFGHLFGSYISPKSDFTMTPPTTASVTTKGNAIYAMINHVSIFPFNLKKGLFTIEVDNGLGIINLHNTLTNLAVENYMFINVKIGLSANYYFNKFQFGIEPIEMEYSYYRPMSLWTYRPSVYLSYLF
jgi:hypothetical protein